MGIFCLKQKKNEYYYRIQHARNSLVNKFQLKQTGLIFWTNFIQTGSFGSEIGKANITIESRISNLDYVPNFSINRQF